MLCKYKHFFGQPNKGAHKYRIANIAIVDLLATLLLAYLIHPYTIYSFPIILAGVFLLGIIAHRVFCVRTTVDKLLFH